MGARERTIASIRICDALGVARVFVRRLIPPFNFQRLSNPFSNLSLSFLSESKDQRKPRNRHLREIFRRQKPALREVQFLGPLEHPGALPRCSLRPAWWKWREV